MGDISLRRILIVAGAACLLLPRLVLPQVPRQSGTLTVTGYPGQVSVIQVNGKSYVELESLARLTSSSISFRARQIILTLPGSAEHTAAPEKNQPVGFSREFLRASIEELTALREWRVAILDAVRSNLPVTDDWVAGYRRT